MFEKKNFEMTRCKVYEIEKKTFSRDLNKAIMLDFNQTFQKTRNRCFENVSNRVVYIRQYSQRKNLACLCIKHFSTYQSRKLLVRLLSIAHRLM